MKEQNLHQSISDFFKKNTSFYLEMLQKMVAINSFTTNAQGIDSLGDLTAEYFAHLGFQSEKIPSIHSDCGHHLVLNKKGSGQHQIGLISHLDTVFSPEEEVRHHFTWRVDADRIYGPGTIDIKGGTMMIYMLLDAIRTFSPAIYDQVNWTVLLDASEEDDASDFGVLCLNQLGKHTLAALVFECGKLDEHFHLVVARKGRAILKVVVDGKASHAGSHHEQGANAVVQLAEIIQKVSSWTDYERHLTFNVGSINGGTVTNRVPHQAEAHFEMRSFSREAYHDGLKRFLALNDFSSVSSNVGDFHCKIKAEIVRETPPWPRNKGTDDLFMIWKEAGDQLGLNILQQERGGLSDGNLICHEIPVLDGLGPLGANAHCSEQSADGQKEQEYLLTPSVIPKATLNTLALYLLLKNKGNISVFDNISEAS